jgi:hypothetical protein
MSTFAPVASSALSVLLVLVAPALAAALCTPAPASCRAPAVSGKALIRLDRGSSCGHNRLLWKWVQGSATTKSDFGDPVGTDDYALCIYDATGLLFEAEVPAGCPGWARCWKESSRAFQYRNKQDQYFEQQQFPPDGVRKALLKSGGDRKAAVVVQGKGCNIFRNTPLEDGLDALASPVTVQLQRSGASTCWGAVYSFPPSHRHDDLHFKDKAD